MKYTFTHLISGIDLDILACSLGAMFLMGVGCSAKKETEPQLEQIPMKQVSVEGININHIAKPTLILWGEDDKFSPLSLGDRIHKDIKGSRMEIIPDCGHFVQEDKPERATEIIIDFLSS